MYFVHIHVHVCISRSCVLCAFWQPTSRLPDGRAATFQKYIRSLVLGQTREINTDISPIRALIFPEKCQINEKFGLDFRPQSNLKDSGF